MSLLCQHLSHRGLESRAPKVYSLAQAFLAERGLTRTTPSRRLPGRYCLNHHAPDEVKVIMEINESEQRATAGDTHPRARTVLLVDDKHDSRITLKWFLDTFGYVVQTARSASEALDIFNPSLHDLVLTDNSMPGMTGAEMSHIIKMRSPHTPVMMYTGEPPADQSCLDKVIQKPAHLMELKSALDKLLNDTLEGPTRGK